MRASPSNDSDQRDESVAGNFSSFHLFNATLGSEDTEMKKLTITCSQVSTLQQIKAFSKHLHTVMNTVQKGGREYNSDGLGMLWRGAWGSLCALVTFDLGLNEKWPYKHCQCKYKTELNEKIPSNSYLLRPGDLRQNLESSLISGIPGHHTLNPKEQ